MVLLIKAGAYGKKSNKHTHAVRPYVTCRSAHAREGKCGNGNGHRPDGDVQADKP